MRGQKLSIINSFSSTTATSGYRVCVSATGASCFNTAANTGSGPQLSPTGGTANVYIHNSKSEELTQKNRFEMEEPVVSDPFGNGRSNPKAYSHI